jgi:NAD(P)-dependent dehydrogenase (short-subunit alcohol dehydrogenase family)
VINPLDLTGKVILVTGASSGIGKETAIHLSRLGAKIILVSRNKDKLHETLHRMEGSGHSVHAFDISEIAKIEELLDKIVREEGKLNGIVHCAGVCEMRPLQLTKYDSLHTMMLVNFYAFFELVRVAAKKNNHEDSSSFIAISSTTSRKGEKSKTAYSASKGALDSAIRSMAKELAPKHIRVNSVVPGYIETEMVDSFIESAGKEEFEKNVLENQYLGLGKTVDVANAVAYLLSDASRLITGTGLLVDGGFLS